MTSAFPAISAGSPDNRGIVCAFHFYGDMPPTTRTIPTYSLIVTFYIKNTQLFEYIVFL